MALTNKQIAEYLETSHLCPYCKSDNITASSSDFDEGGATQEVNCTDCGKTWTDAYELVNIIEEDE